MNQIIEFTLNGEAVRLEAEPDRPLLWALRDDLKLSGTKYGCGIGLCGACSVLLDGTVERSCVLSLQDVAGKSLTTIEGLAQGDRLHPLQRAFMEHDALQCGYCTPGMVIAAAALLAENPGASRADIVAGLDGNLCRCGAHKRILAAVSSVAEGDAS